MPGDVFYAVLAALLKIEKGKLHRHEGRIEGDPFRCQDAPGAEEKRNAAIQVPEPGLDPALGPLYPSRIEVRSHPEGQALHLSNEFLPFLEAARFAQGIDQVVSDREEEPRVFLAGEVSGRFLQSPKDAGQVSGFVQGVGLAREEFRPHQ